MGLAVHGLGALVLQACPTILHAGSCAVHPTINKQGFTVDRNRVDVYSLQKSLLDLCGVQVPAGKIQAL